MAKRVTVRYKGGSHYAAMQTIPAGTEFKAVDADLRIKGLVGVYIRGSSLTKAAQGKHKFSLKQYLFIVSGGDVNNRMEVL
jgi:hypothetical protein